MLGSIISCGSSTGTTETSDLDNGLLLGSWYLLEVGGMRESGRSHYYTVNLNEDCEADSIFFGEEAFPFAETKVNGVWQAYRHFGPEDEVPRGVLKGLLSINCQGKLMEIPLDSIYLNKTVILP